MINHGREKPNVSTFLLCFGKWRMMGLKNPPEMTAEEFEMAASMWCEEAIKAGFCRQTCELARDEIVRSEKWYPSWQGFCDACLKVGPERYRVDCLAPAGSPAALAYVDSWMSDEAILAARNEKRISLGLPALTLDGPPSALQPAVKYDHLSDDEVQAMAEKKMNLLADRKRK